MLSADEVYITLEKTTQTTVQGALDELYGNVYENKIYYLGTETYYDISKILPEIDITKLTEENFIISIDNFSGDSTSHNTCDFVKNNSFGDVMSSVGKITPTYTYDSSSGILKIDNISSKLSLLGQPCAYTFVWSEYKSVPVSLNIKVYLILGKIVDSNQQ